MPAHALIELRDVDIAAGSTSLVRHLSLDIAPGRVLAIVSERADVRTAIAAVLSGATDDYSVEGDLTMDGRELVGRVASQSVTQAEQYVARLQGPADVRVRVRDIADVTILERVHLTAMTVVDERVNSLAEDDRVRAAFAMALARSPRLLVLDLPYGADANTLYPTYSALIQGLSRDGSLTIVVCTDSLAVAADVADDVLVTLDGRPVEYGSVYDICLRPAMPYAQDLLRVTPSPHRVLPEFLAFVDVTRRDGCPWVLSCRADVVRDCSHVLPSMHRVAPGHIAACHLLEAPHGTHA